MPRAAYLSEVGGGFVLIVELTSACSNYNWHRALSSRIELDLVKQVVDFHGGKIEVKSEVGIGSCFSIFLPIGGNGPGNRGEREAS